MSDLEQMAREWLADRTGDTSTHFDSLVALLRRVRDERDEEWERVVREVCGEFTVDGHRSLGLANEILRRMGVSEWR